MATDDEDAGEKSTTFRWLDAVRYTVAAVVTLLIVTVIVLSIKVVLRPESLHLSVVGGAVSSTPLLVGADANVILDVQLRAENPSGRAHMYFFDITAYLFDNKTQASTPTPEDDCIVMLQPTPLHKRISLAQQMGKVLAWRAPVSNDSNVIVLSYFDMLYRERRTISDVTMRVDGSLVTEVRSRINTTSYLVTYYCWPIVVVGNLADDEAAKNRKNVPCVRV